MKRLVLLIVSICSMYQAFAQTNKPYYPKEGDTLPDFVLSDVINYSKKTVSISDFRGKWLVLDWWTTSCLSCIKSFPKMNNLQQKFKGKVNFLMIGDNSKYSKESKKLYEIHQKKHNLKLTMAFDSTSFDKLALAAVPFILVINPKGVIVAKTISLDSAQLHAFISGNKPEYKYAVSRGETVKKSSFDFNLPLLTSGKNSNGGVDTNFLLRSLMCNWNNGMPVGYSNGFSERQMFLNEKGVVKMGMKKKGVAYAIGFSIEDLIRIAHSGSITWETQDPLYLTLNPTIVFELKHFHPTHIGDYKTGTGLFCYSLYNKDLNCKEARETLLLDLEKTFRFKICLEMRAIEVWKLIVTDRRKVAKLQTTSQTKFYRSFGKWVGFDAKNYDVGELAFHFLPALSYLQTDNQFAPILINETGIDFNVDLSLKTDFADFSNFRKALNSVGLDIIRGPYEMKTIVVKDADPLKAEVN